MRTGVIIAATMGEAVPEGYVEQALANNRTCAGFCVQDTKGMHVSKTLSTPQGKFMEVFTKLGKNSSVNVHLANHPEGVLKEDIQPFVLVGTDEKPVIAVMLDGDWANPAPKESKHSDEFFVAMNELRPIITQLYRLTNGNLDVVLQEIDGDATQTNIKNLFINRGTVHLMFNNGAARTISSSELEKTFKWGYVSNHYAYSEDKPPEKVPEPVKEPSGNPLDDLLGVEAPAAPKEEVKAPPVVEQKVTPPARDSKGRPAVGTTIKCPAEIKHPHKIEGWYKHNANFVPSDYMSKPSVVVREKGAGAIKPPVVVKDLKELGSAVKETATRILPDVGSTVEDISKRTPPKLATGPKVPVASTEAVKQPDKPKPVVVHETKDKLVKEEPSKEVVPSMSPEVQKDMIDKFLPATAKMVHTTDLSGKPITDPKDAPALEEKYQGFADRLGINFEDTFAWTVERLQQMMYEYPDAALHYMCESREKNRLFMKTASIVNSSGNKTVVLPKLGQRKTG